MAEGDSIRRIARRLQPALIEQAVLSATAPSPRSPLRSGSGSALPVLAGRRGERIECRGKHLLIHFEGGLTIHSHLGMNGTWQVRGADERFTRPERSGWLLLETPRGEVAQFGGPTLRLVPRAALVRDPRLARLGPDLLDQGFDVEAAAARLRASPEQLGEALLHQRVIAGIGNIFKSEACFEATVDPFRLARTLDPAEARSVIEVAVRQMRAAVETGRRPRQVYRRAGRPCRRCAVPVRSRPQGSAARTTYWCQSCQR